MRFSNHKPSELRPEKAAVPVNGDFDPVLAIRQSMVDPLFEPLVQGTPATLTDNGADVSPDYLTSVMVDMLFDGNVDVDAENAVRSALSKGLVHYDPATPLPLDSAFVTQAATAEGLDWPDKVTVYTPATDVIPAAKEVLAGTSSFAAWFGNLAFFAREANSTLGVSFADDAAFERFKTWLDSQVQMVSSGLPPETIRLFSEFQKLKLDGLTESLALRKDLSDGSGEFSFARMLQRYVLDYTAVEAEPLYGLLPFSASQLACPESIVFVNVSAHSQASPKQVHDEWKLIGHALASPVRIVSQSKLSKLTAAARSAQKMAGRAATAHRMGSDAMQRAMRVRFRNTPPTTVDLVRMVRKVLDKMSNVALSQNSFKSVKPSFMRPNRRDPDNWNLKGQASSTRYKPDIHLYVDTSGSISERDYQDMVKACIVMARKMDVNMYFNSFSHVMSQCAYLPTKGRSIAQVYRQFQKLHKVSGGTDYEQIWRYIEASPKRRKEFSLIITDFEYTAPTAYVKHPENLYYAPCSNVNWDWLTREAQSFCNSMRHIDPLVRRKILI